MRFFLGHEERPRDIHGNNEDCESHRKSEQFYKKLRLFADCPDARDAFREGD
jgi:hypothetical protein